MEVYQNKQTILKLEYPKLREEIPALSRPLFGQGRLQSPWVKSGDRQGLVLHPRGELNRNGEKGSEEFDPSKVINCIDTWRLLLRDCQGNCVRKCTARMVPMPIFWKSACPSTDAYSVQSTYRTIDVLVLYSH